MNKKSPIRAGNNFYTVSFEDDLNDLADDFFTSKKKARKFIKEICEPLEDEKSNDCWREKCYIYKVVPVEEIIMIKNKNIKLTRKKID